MRRKRFELDGALAEACSANENPINRLSARKPEGIYRRMAALYDRKREETERESKREEEEERERKSKRGKGKMLASAQEAQEEGRNGGRARKGGEPVVGGEDRGANL